MTDTQKQKFIQEANTCCPYNVHNGIKVADVGEDFCIVECELREESMNPWGMAHGGFVYSMCDVAAGVVVRFSGRSCVSLSGNMYYLRPSKGKKLRAEGKIIKDGKTVVVVDTTVFDETGKLTAKGSFEVYALSAGNGTK